MYCERKTKRTQRNHRCIWCYELIPAGSSAGRVTGIWEGDFFSNYYHDECLAASHSGAIDLYDGFDPGSFKRGTCEEK